MIRRLLAWLTAPRTPDPAPPTAAAARLDVEAARLEAEQARARERLETSTIDAQAATHRATSREAANQEMLRRLMRMQANPDE